MLTGIVTAVAAGLILAGLSALSKSRKLYLIAPKLYFETPLSGKGHIVTLTISNAGFRTEENVQVTLKKTCTYELLASSHSTTSFHNYSLSIPRLTRSESVTTLLLAEGKAFEHSDIESVSSKDTIGRVVENKEQASRPLDALLIPLLLISLFSVPFIIGTFVGKSAGLSAWDYARYVWESFGPSKQLAGYRVERAELHTTAINGTTVKGVKAGVIATRVKEVVRQGDVLIVHVEVSNKSDRFVSVDVKGKSPAGTQGPLSWDDERITGMLVAQTGTGRGALRLFLPEALKAPSFYLDITLHSGPESVWYTDTVILE